MQTKKLDELIKLYKQGKKELDSIVSSFRSIQLLFDNAIIINPYSEESKKKAQIIIKENPSIKTGIKIIKKDIDSFNRGWTKKVKNKLRKNYNRELVVRFHTAIPNGLGSGKSIYAEIDKINSSLHTPMARLYELSNIIFELSAKIYELPPLVNSKNNFLFSFTLEGDEDILVLNGKTLKSFKAFSSVREDFVKAFRNPNKYIIISNVHNCSQWIYSLHLPAPLKKSFAHIRSDNTMKINPNITKSTILLYCKDSNELAELIKKYT